MKWRSTSISPFSPDSRNCLTAWTDLHRRVALNYLNPIYLNVNTCKWDSLITSAFRLAFRWGKRNSCYQGILRWLLTCLIVYFISETPLSIDLNQCTMAVSWHLCIEKSNECLLKKTSFHCFWYMRYTCMDTPETFELSAQCIVHTSVSLMNYSEVILK